MREHLVAFTYGYSVCLGSLALCAYALVTLLPPSAFLRNLQPVQVSVLSTDTTATTATDTTATSLATEPVLTANDPKAEIESLRASQKSFDAAKAELEAERDKLHSLSIRGHLFQRVLLIVFSSSVFTFHWRWLRRISAKVTA